MSSPDATAEPAPILLSVNDLSIQFPGAGPVVNGITFDVRAGEVLAIAGQSGSGKSMTGLAIMGLLPDGASVTGSIRYRGKELVGASEASRVALRGAEMAMVFQETTTALNPVLTIKTQLTGAIRAHYPVSKAKALERAAQALRDVSITDTERVLHSYPHQLSGGMCQRAVIAMALACGSHLLIADEPTTALDVSVQRGILSLLGRLVREKHLACIFVSHDLGVLEEVADNVLVMLDGRVVEQGPMVATIGDPLHPYTAELLSHLTPLLGWRDDEPFSATPVPTPGSPSAANLTPCARAAHECGPDQPLIKVAPDRYVRCGIYKDVSEPTRAGV